MDAKIQTLKSLKAEMLAVARGKQKAPSHASRVSYESAYALLHLLTEENRQLLALIHEKKPASVATLAQLANRAESNVSRTLSKLVASGLVRLREGQGKAKVPEVIAHHITVDINLFQLDDRISIV